MADLTSLQRQDLRLDIGLPGTDQTVFSDNALDRLWTRLEGASSDNSRLEATKGLMLLQLVSSAAKLHDYELVATAEKNSQVFDHLWKLFQMYKQALDNVLGTTISQFAKSSIRVIPRDRSLPYTATGDLLRMEYPPDVYLIED